MRRMTCRAQTEGSCCQWPKVKLDEQGKDGPFTRGECARGELSAGSRGVSAHPTVRWWQQLERTEGSRKACHPFSPLMRARRKEMTADAMRIFTRRSSNCFNTSFQKGVPGLKASIDDERRIPIRTSSEVTESSHTTPPTCGQTSQSWVAQKGAPGSL